MTIFKVLQEIEKLIYKVLMWVILLPKTIVKIVVQPKWASKYVHDELHGSGEADESKGEFDEYISPVILLLIVALLPSLGYNALPRFGATLSSPAETNLTTDRFLSFEAQADFISASTELENFAKWEVWQKTPDGDYTLVKSDFHPREDGSNAIETVDNNTVKDRFLYTFDPGDYYVYVSVGNVDVTRTESPTLESYDAYVTVTVPLGADEQVRVSSDNEQALEQKTAQSSDFLSRVKDEQTIFLALALMMPPLLFAFASKVFRGDAITEGTLKDNFYVQCYYFSPLSLAIWSTYYALYFFTPDAYLYFGSGTALQVLLFPLTLGVLWFVRAEIKYMAWERKTPTWRAAIIVILCIGILGFLTNVIYSFDTYMNGVRLFAVRLFPILGILLMIGYAYAWLGRRRKNNEKIIGVNIAGFVILAGVFLVVMSRFADYTGLNSTVPVVVIKPHGTGAAVVVEVTATQAAVVTQESTAPIQSTPTVVLNTPTPTSQPTQTLELPRFYTEEFNNPLVRWFDFMTYGDSRMVDEEVDLGNLSVSLNPLEDKYAWYYLINNTFTYSDVKVETVVTNQGNNSNGISLICRYSDVGWYETVFSSSGTYTVYAVDNQGLVNQGYNRIGNGGSALINQGLKTNVYAMECRENQLILFINNEEVNRVVDRRFELAEGKIGLAVSATKNLPVNVDFESFTVSEP